jgi:hypothetical protein
MCDVLQREENARQLNNRSREHFRMPFATLDRVVQLVAPRLTQRVDTNYRPAVTPWTRVALAVYRLAKGCGARDLAEIFAVGASTACTACREVYDVLGKELLPHFISFPRGRRLEQVMTGFHLAGGLPMCAGAIDGSHIAIVPPADQPADYFNRKHFYSIVLQAVVDADGEFTDVDIGFPGRTHDARVYALSPLAASINNGLCLRAPPSNVEGQAVRPYLVGDAAYGLSPAMMVPFRGNNLPAARAEYNHAQSATRMPVEQAFGRLKNKWQVLIKPIHTHSLDAAVAIVAACCVLHNIVGGRHEPMPLPDQAEQLGNEPEPRDIRGEDAQAVREALVRHLQRRRQARRGAARRA